MALNKSSEIFAKDWVAFLLFCLVTLLLYVNSLNSPFYFDDIPQIVNQSFTYNLSEASQLFFKPRGIANFTFALNYHFFGMSLPAFHTVNISLHLLTTFFVFLILKRVFPDSRSLCYFGAIVFLCHPLQTQSVTYIVQRMTVLCGFFLFLSLFLYVKAKEELLKTGFFSRKHVALYLSFVVTAALAVLAKQNAATLPVLFYLFDSVFLSKSRFFCRKRAVYLLPALLMPVWLGFEMVITPLLGGDTLSKLGNFETLDAAKDATTALKVSPLIYFYTELSVFWIYIKLLFFPVGQTLDYGYPLVEKFFTWKTVSAALGVFALFTIAVSSRYRYPFVFFAIIWFFVALAVESTFIPLDPVFEHRLYIPMFGFAIFLAAGFNWLADVTKRGRLVLVFVCLISLGFAGLTVRRNSVWADPVRFYQSEVANTYGSYRPSIMLADEYYKRGFFEQSKVEYDQIVKRIEKQSIRNLHPKMLLNIAIAYGRFNDFAKAERLLRLALKRSPMAPDIRYNLGISLYLQGRQLEAFQEFSTAWRLNPGNPDAFYYYILLNAKFGEKGALGPMLEQMQKMNPIYAEKLRMELGF